MSERFEVVCGKTCHYSVLCYFKTSIKTLLLQHTQCPLDLCRLSSSTTLKRRTYSIGHFSPITSLMALNVYTFVIAKLKPKVKNLSFSSSGVQLFHLHWNTSGHKIPIWSSGHVAMLNQSPGNGHMAAKSIEAKPGASEATQILMLSYIPGK